MSLREDIQAVMSEQGVTAYAVSMKSGIDQGLLSRYFSGKSALSVKSLDILLGVLGYELTIRRKKRKVVLENETAREK
jgi:transcriptional regulator with XRE-family HTH domain